MSACTLGSISRRKRPPLLASHNQLRALLPLGSTLSLRVKAVDRYGRSVAEVLGRGVANLAMVQSGQAFDYHQYLGRCERGGLPGGGTERPGPAAGGVVRSWGDYAALAVQAWGLGALQGRGGPSRGILQRVRP